MREKISDMKEENDELFFIKIIEHHCFLLEFEIEKK